MKTAGITEATVEFMALDVFVSLGTGIRDRLDLAARVRQARFLRVIQPLVMRLKRQWD